MSAGVEALLNNPTLVLLQRLFFVLLVPISGYAAKEFIALRDAVRDTRMAVDTQQATSILHREGERREYERRFTEAERRLVRLESLRERDDTETGQLKVELGRLVEVVGRLDRRLEGTGR